MSTDVASAALDLTTRSHRALDDAGAALERIERVDGADRSSVLEPYDEAWLRVETVGAECSLMKEVHPDPNVRRAAEDLSLGFGPDLMNVRQARRYRDIVLGQGGLKPALALVEEFLGRPHDLAAYRRWLG